MDNNTTTGSNPIPCQKEETLSLQELMILTNSGTALLVMILVEIIKIIHITIYLGRFLPGFFIGISLTV